MEIEQSKWMKHGFQLAVVALFSVCGALYAQQNSIIATQGETSNKACIEINKRIDEKVDSAVMIEMIKTINVKLEYDSQRWGEQQEINKNVSETMQNLNENIIMLNEQMKK